MDPTIIAKLASDAPIVAILLYLLLKEMHDHEVTRQAWREDARQWLLIIYQMVTGKAAPAGEIPVVPSLDLNQRLDGASKTP